MKQVIGIDIGGTKIAYALVNETGEVLTRLRLATEPERPWQAVVDTVAQGIQTLLHEHKGEISGIGIGCPGVIDSVNGIVRFAANLYWEDVPLVDGLIERIPALPPVRLDNDVRSAAMGEMRFGSATSDNENFIYIAIGTGLGAAAVVNGQLMRGAAGSSMEIGHVITSDEPRRRFEQTVSGIGMMTLYEDLKARFPQSKLAHASEISPHDILAAPDDPLTRAILAAMSLGFGQALSWVCTVLNPELIVIGGGLGLALMPHIQAEVEAYVQAHTLPVVHEGLRFRLSSLDDSALGAACLVL